MLRGSREEAERVALLPWRHCEIARAYLRGTETAIERVFFSRSCVFCFLAGALRSVALRDLGVIFFSFQRRCCDTAYIDNVTLEESNTRFSQL